MTRQRRLFAMLILAMAAPGSALGGDAAQREALSAEALSDLRGGFVLPNGAAVSIAADLQSYVDGARVLDSRLVLSDSGWVGANGSATPELPASLGGLQGLAGRTIAGAGGSTTLVHALRDTQVLNVVVNDATGRTVAQHLGIEMRLDNYWEMREAWSNDLLAIRLSDPTR